MIRFYAPQLPDNPVLPESDSGHAVRVLRLRVGDSIEAVDGRGNLYRCTIVDAHPKHTMVRVDSVESLEKSWRGDIIVGIAPTKHSDRMEWLVEKLVEIGVDRIVCLRCRRSERKEINVDRLRKIAVAAMKQSLKARLPEVDGTVAFSDFLSDYGPSDNSRRLIAYCDPSVERVLMTDVYRPGLTTVVLIGPEGDFDPDEIRMALDQGWMPVSLGDERLRTETAALYAVATCHVLESAHSHCSK